MSEQDSGVDAERLLSAMPRHVAIIMDGNGRWAERRGKPRYRGHWAGVRAVRDVVRFCSDREIRALTLFAFSSENWRRPKREVGMLMELFLVSLRREVSKLHKENVRLRFIGELEAFPPRLLSHIRAAEEKTRDNSGLTLSVAANYGGRWDITQAARRIAERVAAGELQPAAVDPELLQSHLCLADLPEPDLFIRTGGEQRISNFLLWQLAYSELYFTETLWPDFNAESLEQAFAWFASRQRRFGMTGAQVESLKGA